ncbi:hypothetical protein [Anaerosoma tenue]|uniref:hypothetical protein n=1 Tax=Anaerosoma tenue TaxID=2933588 RepID=UPI0022608692|nr:hypothetical protein [Anaerosoma tenue]MCK8115087.1 hypothetical protein [Anaerosoma tenue]
MVRRLLIGALVGALALALVGCSGGSDTAAEEVAGSAVGGDVDVDDENVTISTDDGDITFGGGDGELGNNFPSDIPIHPDAEVSSSSSIVADAGSEHYADLYVDDSVAAVYDWHVDELSSSGWAIGDELQMTTDDGEFMGLEATKGSMQLYINVNESDDGSEVSIAARETP